MKIIAGLGNPGPQYENTPHSIGFEVVDEVARRMGAEWREKRSEQSLVCRGTYGGADVVCVKPLTFMNLSGNAVAPAVRYANASPADLVVVHDDIDLPAGRMRIKRGGGAGGHNGVRNVSERLGSPDFIRLKIGVGKDPSNVIGHVLGRFDPAARDIMDRVVPAAADAVLAILRDGPDRAMNAFNPFDAAKPSPDAKGGG